MDIREQIRTAMLDLSDKITIKDKASADVLDLIKEEL